MGVSDMVGKVGKGMPEWFTYAKARASFAQVGNDYGCISVI